MKSEPIVTRYGQIIEDPPFVKFLFGNTKLMGIVWLVVRVLTGLQWVEAASHKLSSPAWMETGEALKGFWTAAVQIPEAGRPPINYDWYRNFIQGMLDSGAYVWFAKLIAIGELLVGVVAIITAALAFYRRLHGLVWEYMREDDQPAPEGCHQLNFLNFILSERLATDRAFAFIASLVTIFGSIAFP